jgi:exodeoxyribonuclease V alpha subunit
LQIIHRKLLSLGEVIAVAALRDTVAAINDDESYFRRTRDARTVRLGPQATVAVGDPVVATKNRYRDGLFNGTLGVVSAIDSDDRVQVLWEGETEARLLEKEAGLDVELAYAITCHRAQGSSARNVVVVLEDCALSTREWLYTAITRARELVILVGDEALLGSTVSRRTQRVTGFRM